MSTKHHHNWFERNWSWAVILFAVLFVALLDGFAPTI